MRARWPTVLAAVVVSVGAGWVRGDEKWGTEVTRLAQPLVDGGLVPGLVVGVYDGGRVETYGLGVVSADRPVAPDARTVYEIGSVTKVFTALLLADAVGRDEAALDDPLSRLLPAGVEAPKRDGREITLEELATHFSGLPRLPANMAADSLDDPYAAYGREELFAFVNGHHPVRTPGSAYEYSNLGMGLLGALLADRAKMGYDAVLRERIAGPLAMDDTGVRLTEERRERLAPGHRAGSRVPNWEFDALAGCGGVRSTVEDMMNLVAAHADPASSPLKEAVELASRRRRAVAGTPSSIALGWNIAADGSTLWHNGQTGGYSAAVFVNPVLKKGVVVLANGSDSTVEVLGVKLLQTITGMTVEPPAVRKSMPVTDAQLDRLVGEYPSARGFTIWVTRQGDVLMTRLTGQPALRVFPESPTRFFYREVAAELEFEMDETGERAKAVTLHQNGAKMRCERRL